jgi:pimeloyl-ACP methyl ester carboxylesterase
LVEKLICLGGPILTPNDYKGGSLENLKTLTGDLFEKEMPEFVKGRKVLMPQPDRWNDFVEKLKNCWLQPVYIDKTELTKLKCPLLMICGDRDQYVSLENYTNIYRQFNNAQIAVIPNSDHVVLFTRPDLVESNVMTFVLK